MKSYLSAFAGATLALPSAAVAGLQENSSVVRMGRSETKGRIAKFYNASLQGIAKSLLCVKVSMPIHQARHQVLATCIHNLGCTNGLSSFGSDDVVNDAISVYNGAMLEQGPGVRIDDGCVPDHYPLCSSGMRAAAVTVREKERPAANTRAARAMTSRSRPIASHPNRCVRRFMTTSIGL